jgi:hypothetical protein
MVTIYVQRIYPHKKNLKEKIPVEERWKLELLRSNEDNLRDFPLLLLSLGQVFVLI